jgi:acetyl esterase/lipase
MPLDPQADALLAQMREAGVRPFEELTVPEAREAAWGYLALAGEPQPVASVDNRFIPGPTADLPVRIYTPEGGGPRGGIVFFHGSGWVIANIDICDAAVRSLANSTGCVVVSVNYQKAPEHPFPRPFDDCWAATSWVYANAAEIGIDPARLAVAGDSAGGNLAAAVCLKARDEGGPPIVFQVLVYPALDRNWDTASAHENAEGYGLQRETMRWFWNHYVPSEADADNPLVSPLRAADLSGLPPAFIATAEFDPLRDDGEMYAERLAEAGVPVLLKRYDGMIHGFYWMLGALDQARVLHEDIAGAATPVLTPVATA